MLEREDTFIETNNEKDKLIRTIFDIWLVKEFTYNGTFQKYYQTFIDEKGNFKESLLKNKLDEIYNLISNHNITIDRPNNISNFSDEKLKNIILDFGDSFNSSDFANDILTQIQGSTIKMKYEGLVEDFDKRDLENDNVKQGLLKFLNNLYNNGFNKISNTTSTTIEEIIRIIS